MRVIGLDFESTGLDTKEDRITEIGAVIWDVELKRPLVTYGVFLYNDSYFGKLTPSVLEMMGRICGITQEMLIEFGQAPKPQFEWLERACKLHRIDYIIAHNGAAFDRPLLLAELDRNGVDAPNLKAIPWLDTKKDIPFEAEPESRKLKHLALDAGFINPFAHRAVFDVLTMLKVFSQYPMSEIVAQSQIPEIIIRAMVPHPKYDGGMGKDKAKAQGFRWQEIDGKQFPAMWVKKIKETKLQEEKEKLGEYEIVRLA